MGDFSPKAPRGRRSRRNAGGDVAEPGKEALFGTETPPEQEATRTEKRLLEDLDEEIGKGGKAAVAKTKPRLAEVGQRLLVRPLLPYDAKLAWAWSSGELST